MEDGSAGAICQHGVGTAHHASENGGHCPTYSLFRGVTAAAALLGAFGWVPKLVEKSLVNFETRYGL